MNKEEAITQQYGIMCSKIEEAKENGKTRLFVQPLHHETISKLESDGLTIERILLMGQELIGCFDIVDFRISPVGCFEENRVEPEEFMAILKMVELGL